MWDKLFGNTNLSWGSYQKRLTKNKQCSCHQGNILDAQQPDNDGDIAWLMLLWSGQYWKSMASSWCPLVGQCQGICFTVCTFACSSIKSAGTALMLCGFSTAVRIEGTTVIEVIPFTRCKTICHKMGSFILSFWMQLVTALLDFLSGQNAWLFCSQTVFLIFWIFGWNLFWGVLIPPAISLFPPCKFHCLPWLHGFFSHLQILTPYSTSLGWSLILCNDVKPVCI